MRLKFTKMHGLGNDFVVFDAISQTVALSPAQFRFIGDRHFGVGCDQILLVEKPTRSDADFRYRIFNADGGEVEQCGNGARCFVRFVHDQGLTAKREIRVETASGIIVPRLEENGEVTVNMGAPRFEPSEIPFTAAARAMTYPLELSGKTVEISAVSMGKLSPAQFRFIGDRHFGVGCDQILLVEKPTRSDADFRYRIFNADGGEVEQCGNGARCFVRFVHDKGLTAKREIRVETASGIIVPRLEENGEVTVDMGAPRFEPSEIPFIAESRAAAYPLELSGKTVEISAVSMGNPHAVTLVDDADAWPVGQDGPQIERHARFPARVNAGFMQVMDRHSIKLRVYERGAGETLACGTGACAAAVAGIARGLLDSPVRVATRGGELSIAWDGEGTPVLMTGPAVAVFDGELEVPVK